MKSTEGLYLPSASEIVGTLDEQRSRSEGLERHDQVSEVELGLQIQLDGDVLDAILRLPPGTSPIPATKSCHMG